MNLEIMHLQNLLTIKKLKSHSSVYKLCIIGLGNPGSKYNNTRHNIGKDWLLNLSKSFIEEFKNKSRFEADVAESHNGNILWVVPDNYVNNSGKTVIKILKKTNLKITDILIMHDDLDLDIGELRLKEDGGHGGHNGLRDIITKLGDYNFKRLRIGIGHPGSKSEVTNWVLNKFSSNEKKIIKDSFVKLDNIFELIINNKFKSAQKSLHTK